MSEQASECVRARVRASMHAYVGSCAVYKPVCFQKVYKWSIFEKDSLPSNKRSIFNVQL